MGYNDNILSEIRPSRSILPHPPRREPYKNVSLWFKDETMVVSFGDTVGRPHPGVLLKTEYITRFLENGWTIDSVMSSSSDGRWETVSSTESTANPSVVSKSDSYSESSSETSWSSSSSGSRSYGQDTVETKDGPVYWYAINRVRLRRRRMQPEKVMQDMMNSFTDQYNHGKTVDDQRFNELMSLYSVVLRHNEAEGNKILNLAINPDAFLNQLYSSTWSAFDAAKNAAFTLSTTASVDATNEVNRKFDALVEKTKAEMISAGTYNSTVWPSVLVGIERERAAALVKAKSEGSQISVNALTSLGSSRASAASAFAAAKQAIADSLDKRRVTVVEMRNNVVKWILDFVEKREEVYPELEEISSIAERLGFSVGSAGNVL